MTRYLSPFYTSRFSKAAITIAALLVMQSPISLAKETAATAQPVAELKPYSASYSATMSGIPVNGNAERTLSQNPDGSWTLSFDAEMLLYSLTEKSRFRFANGQIQPEAYRLQKGALGRKDTATVEFDWGKKIANSRENKDSWQVNLSPADLDRISYQQQLQLDVAKGLKEFSYQVIDEDEKDNYRFRIDGEELLETPAGPLKTVRLVMVRDNNKRQTTLWLARDWNDLLVQLKQTEKGKDYIVTLKKAVVDNKTVTGQKSPGSSTNTSTKAATPKA
ncbi:DUF3108 domain-containing protein [Parendozoicomonas haliclonae]|uniref:DUF3108 domain-containing protein n=1 Tax=Parendozoicomonas haliclonae TaxID=1960125 RepID=A0A1X7APC2_9GAMM|nr:DUF3108 domain-containing protein [Parendozoicomonas haliclonae]SMA50105.1 hypothetical protein EHSB41UT_03896 [Parendozoicomonas haliclonae]